MNTEKNHHSSEYGALQPYIVGFLLSLVLTFGSYLVVVYHLFDTTLLVTVLIGLALVQLVVQLLFFLHLGQEKKPRWNLIFFIATAGVVFLVVVGSIWIMNNLNYNMMPGQKMDQQILKDELITPR
jgi:cytochrome o ubiquinol oxidase operon protein cyoD